MIGAPAAGVVLDINGVALRRVSGGWGELRRSLTSIVEMRRCYGAAMRTTLNIDDDLLAVARALAEEEGRSLGEVVSRLLRRALEPAPVDYEDGFPVFRVPPGTAPITSEMVRRALDEDV